MFRNRTVHSCREPPAPAGLGDDGEAEVSGMAGSLVLQPPAEPGPHTGLLPQAVRATPRQPVAIGSEQTWEKEGEKKSLFSRGPLTWPSWLFRAAGSGFALVLLPALAPRLFPPERAKLCADRGAGGTRGAEQHPLASLSHKPEARRAGVREGLPIRPTRAARKAAGNTERASLLAQNKTRDPGTRGPQGNMFDFRKSQDVSHYKCDKYYSFGRSVEITYLNTCQQKSGTAPPPPL